MNMKLEPNELANVRKQLLDRTQQAQENRGFKVDPMMIAQPAYHVINHYEALLKELKHFIRAVELCPVDKERTSGLRDQAIVLRKELDADPDLTESELDDDAEETDEEHQEWLRNSESAAGGHNTAG